MRVVNPNYATDGVRQYLREIGEIPMLTREEEIGLAKRIELYNIEVKKEKALQNPMVIASGVAAHKEFVERNLRLVPQIAQHYYNPSRPNFLDLEDLISEGNIELIKAAWKYDYRKARFSTFAAWLIRHEVIRSIQNQENAIRVPVYEQEAFFSFRRAQQEFEFENGRTATPEELARLLGISQERMKEFEELHSILKLPESLDIINDDENSTLGATIPDSRARGQFDAAEIEALNLGVLEPRERRIIELRYGLEGHEELRPEGDWKKDGIVKTAN